jgi:phosphopantetheinyl transferase
MTVEAFLQENGRRFGFSSAVQDTAEVAANLDAEGDAYAATIVTDEERLLFGRLRVHKRRVEWLAGRIAAKRAFGRLSALRGDFAAVPQISVLSRANRAPYIDAFPELRVSISHSHDYAVAVIAPFGIGVDIEKTEPRPRGLAEYFFSTEEQVLLDGMTEPARRHELVTLLWSRKEALSKFLLRGGELAFRELNVIPDRVCVTGRFPGWVRLVSGTPAGYCLTLALEGLPFPDTTAPA